MSELSYGSRLHGTYLLGFRNTLQQVVNSNGYEKSTYGDAHGWEWDQREKLGFWSDTAHKLVMWALICITEEDEEECDAALNPYYDAFYISVSRNSPGAERSAECRALIEVIL